MTDRRTDGRKTTVKVFAAAPQCSRRFAPNQICATERFSFAACSPENKTFVSSLSTNARMNPNHSTTRNVRGNVCEKINIYILRAPYSATIDTASDKTHGRKAIRCRRIVNVVVCAPNALILTSIIGYAHIRSHIVYNMKRFDLSHPTAERCKRLRYDMAHASAHQLAAAILN